MKMILETILYTKNFKNILNFFTYFVFDGDS